MALSDCPKCWDTPCTCGHYWRNYSLEAKKKQVEAIMGEEMYSKEEILNALHKVELKHNKNYSKIWKGIEENL